MRRTGNRIPNQKFKEYLFKNKIKQKDIAQYAGVSPAYISMIVNGAVMPCRPIMDKICEYFKCESEEIGFINFETGDYIQIEYMRDFAQKIVKAEQEAKNGQN